MPKAKSGLLRPPLFYKNDKNHQINRARIPGRPKGIFNFRTKSHPMKFGILKEYDDQRVAIVPEIVPKLKQLGLEILVETQAGATALFSMRYIRSTPRSSAGRKRCLKATS